MIVKMINKKKHYTYFIFNLNKKLNFHVYKFSLINFLCSYRQIFPLVYFLHIVHLDLFIVKKRPRGIV